MQFKNEPQMIPCTVCHGTGADVEVTCPDCQGTGYDPQDGNPFAQCHTCYGDGTTMLDVCPHCGGDGEIDPVDNELDSA